MFDKYVNIETKSTGSTQKYIRVLCPHARSSKLERIERFECSDRNEEV